MAFVLSLSLLNGCPALAASSGAMAPESTEAGEMAGGSDNRIEWEEIGALVRAGNPVYTKARVQAGASLELLKAGYDSFVTDMHSAMDEVDDGMETILESQKTLLGLPPGTRIPDESGGTKTREEALLALKAGLQSARAGRRELSNGIRKSADAVNKAEKSIERNLLPVEKQLTKALQDVVISYQQLAANRTMLAKQAALYETVLSLQLELQEQGSATGYDVRSAENDLQSAKASLRQLDSNLEAVRRAVGLQLGFDETSLPEIGALPEPELSFADTTNPEADKTAALMHNSALHTAGKAVYRSSYGYELRDRTENEAAGMLTAKMDALYADLKQKKALYETAQVTLEKARLTKEGAERKYALGMLGRAEYEAQQLAYTSYEAAFALAKINLFQAIHTYRWAVDGYVSLD